MNVFLDQQSEILYSLFLMYIQVEGYQNILKLRCWPLAFISYKAFLKKKKRSGTILPTSFLHDFSSKMFLMLYSINWPNLIVWLLLPLEILGNICGKTNFEINLSFLIKPLSYKTKKVKTKNKSFLRTKRAF